MRSRRSLLSEIHTAADPDEYKAQGADENPSGFFFGDCHLLVSTQWTKEKGTVPGYCCVRSADGHSRSWKPNRVGRP